MILRDYLKLIFSIWLSVSALINVTSGERWSRQVSNSEWIPLAHPRSQIPQSSAPNNQSPPLPSIQNLNLPPALRQEYQQQLHQLQKTQESIHKLLLLQQQLRSQQQLLQNQGYLPNVVGPEEEKQLFRQNSVSNVQQHSDLNPDGLSSPQLSADVLPAVYSSQEFKPSHQNQEVAEVPSTSVESEEKPENGSNEEIQVVYVPAETLAQRGQSKEERNRDHKQFSFPRQQNQRYPQRHQQQHHQQQEQVDNVEGPVNYSDERPSFNSELVQFPRGQAENDQFLKEARQKELNRLNEERKEIQKQAKIQAAARQREQERIRQKETEKKLKELAQIEEMAKQNELDRIREEREHHRLGELKRERERVSKLKEELGRREIERLTGVERQKQAEMERSRARQKELEKFARQEEEARTKELAAKKETAETPTAQQLVNQQQQQVQQQHLQHHTETGKHQKRVRNKSRQRTHQHHHKHTGNQLNRNHEVETTTPTPNQPPLAVFMGAESQIEEVKIVDVLRVLRDVKTIAVLDQFVPEAPKVFVGPSNLDPAQGYTKFDLPYLSTLDTNRVERRVDKLPFFVAPLNFNPPNGYSKIPFPAPHIGSVIINNFESNVGPSGGGLKAVHKPTPNPLIEPNSFIANSGQGSTYQASYESPTVTPYSTYSQEQVTPQYQSSIYASTPVEKYRYQQQPEQQQYEQPTGPHNLKYPQSESISSYDEPVTASPRPHHNSEYTEESYIGQVTPDDYRRPGVVTSFSYNQEQVSTTPAYQDSYAHTRVQPNKEQDLTSQLAQLNQHDFSQHRHIDNNYQQPSQQANINQYHQQYHLSSNSPNTYEETSNRSPVGPPQYSLPAELPPIHPQLPGLINSLSEHKETDKIITTTTTTPTPITTTTIETPTTTSRVRSRQRGRITRPSTTSTTTSSPSTYRSHTERTRRPFNRSRSRYSTTTEEYRETSYEVTKDKVPDTTPRYSNSPEQYRRPVTPKIHKFKTRAGGSDRTTYEPVTTLNQLPNIQTHETLSDEASPSEISGDLRQTTYMQYSVPISTDSTSNAYLHHENVENPVNSYSPEINYSTSPSYPRIHGPPRNEGTASNNVPISQHEQQYHDRYPAQSAGYQASLDRQPFTGYEYNIGDGIGGSMPTASSTPSGYSYYPDKIEGVQLVGNDEKIQTEAPLYKQILEYAATPKSKVQQSQLVNEDYSVPSNFDDRNRDNIGDEQLYNKYSSKEYSKHQTETTTEPIHMTTSEITPVVYRQRLRTRLGGRPRQDSPLQTQSVGSEDDYVRFSAVNPTPSGGRPSSSTSSSRSRDSTRSRSKTRPNHNNQVQVQTEGNEYVRIQSAHRPATYPKTILQTAKPKISTTTTTTTTTTTVSPLTTTEQSSSGEADDYGFIRSPNFNSAHQLSSKFRAPESPIQLQNVAPTDETAEDSSPTHSQVPKLRQRYHTPNRPRLVIKSTTPSSTTQSNYDNGPYTTKSRVRADEPKNRIRTKGRRPGRKRTTTTTTTTEYTLEGNNNLPSDENYPRIQINSDESHIERQQPLYEQSYEIPQNSNANVGSSRADYVEENYPHTGFAINFGGDTDTDEQHDQSQLSHKYHITSDYRTGSPSESRLRTYSNYPMSSERDIYGSESQWSTKLTKSSFQPVNQLNQNEEKVYSNEHASQEMKEDMPEIITAQPEDAFITVLVTSDDTENKTKSELTSSSSSSSSPSESVINSADFGQKTSHSNIEESSTEHSKANSTSEIPQPRRVGQRRRRVRVRVRPLPPDDFVTAESQYFNSAVNSLVQDRVKYNTHVDSSSEIHSKPSFENLAEKQTWPSPLDSVELSNSSESITPTDTTTINYTEITEHARQSEISTLPSISSDGGVKINNSNEDTPMTTEVLTTNFETTVNDLTTTAPLMTTMTIPRKSWDSTRAYSDWIMSKMEKSFTSGDNQLNDKSEINEDSNRQNVNSSAKLLEKESETYPKNHRSEWSEVHYPSDRGIYGYGRSEKLSPTTQLPGIITKSVGDTNVKTISDYVQAIFDTMKNADEEHAIVDNAPNLWSDDQLKLTTSTEVYDVSSTLSTAIPLEKISTTSVTLEDYEGKDKIAETTIQQNEKDIINTTPNVVETSSENSSMQTNTETTTASATNASSITTTPEPSITTIELTVTPDKNMTSKVSSVIRTSTTTKVSHMTEICYRGRCVMTKPKKEFHER